MPLTVTCNVAFSYTFDNETLSISQADIGRLIAGHLPSHGSLAWMIPTTLLFIALALVQLGYKKLRKLKRSLEGAYAKFRALTLAPTLTLNLANPLCPTLAVALGPPSAPAVASPAAVRDVKKTEQSSGKNARKPADEQAIDQSAPCELERKFRDERERCHSKMFERYYSTLELLGNARSRMENIRMRSESDARKRRWKEVRGADEGAKYEDQAESARHGSTVDADDDWNEAGGEWVMLDPATSFDGVE